MYSMEILQRTVWAFVVCASVSYSIYLVAGSALQAQAEALPLRLQDEIAPGVHYLSGMLDVESTCAYVTVRSEKLSPQSVRLILETVEQTALECDRASTPRTFAAVVRAPAVGVIFSAVLNGEPVALEMHARVRAPLP